MVRYTLSKSERLSSLKTIEKLFKEGRGLTKYPIRLVWLPMNSEDVSEFPARVMFSASKKKFSKAVDRNKIKRLLREGYRLYKPKFYNALPPGQTFCLALIYTGSEIMSQDAIQKKITIALEGMLVELSK